MNPRLISVSFVSFVPPIALSRSMYAFCRYVREKADAIVTETEDEEEQRRRDLVAALSLIGGVRPASTKKHSEP